MDPTVTTSSPVLHSSSVAPPPTIKTGLPALVIPYFEGDFAKWQRFWEQFSASIDCNNSISTIDKHVFLRSYLREEPLRLVSGIAITADLYDETKRILQQKYGDENRIIQAHVDFLDAISPVPDPTPQALSDLFIECPSRLQSLKALGQDIKCLGRILVPKILRAFPDDLCKLWKIHSKTANVLDSDLDALIKDSIY